MNDRALSPEQAQQILCDMFKKYMPWEKPENVFPETNADNASQPVSNLLKVCFERIAAQTQDQQADHQTMRLLNAFEEGFAELIRRGTKMIDSKGLEQYKNGVDSHSRETLRQQFQTADELQGDFVAIVSAADVLGVPYRNPMDVLTPAKKL